MKLTPYRWAGLVAGFVLLLLYATVVSLPSPPPTGVEHDAEGAGRACTRAVRERVPDARFPFAANVTYLGEARYQLNGQVDAMRAGEMVRRNYECLVSYAGSGTYEADSLRLWQSH